MDYSFEIRKYSDSQYLRCLFFCICISISLSSITCTFSKLYFRCFNSLWIFVFAAAFLHLSSESCALFGLVYDQLHIFAKQQTLYEVTICIFRVTDRIAFLFKHNVFLFSIFYVFHYFIVFCSQFFSHL